MILEENDPMIKRLAKSLREFKTQTYLTLLLIVGEAVIETLIPFKTAELVNSVKENAGMEEVLRLGLLLTVLAVISLSFGGLAGYTCSKASAGFARNLRGDMFRHIQSFDFENIDKFSSSSLVTRMTTDVSNIQMAFMMIIRTAVRSPLMLIFSTVMAFVMGGWVATAFVVVIPVLAFGLIMIGKKALPAFRSVFRKYDKLNESIEENVRGIRVVKGFAREEFEKKKFDSAADNIRRDFTKAERIVALNNPLMNFCLYFIMVFVLIAGSKLAVSSGGAAFDVGQMSGMLVYGMQILMSLMMLSMIYVIVTMSGESAKRVCEVLEETPTLSEPEDALYELKDGSVVFENVSFKYSKTAEANALNGINLKIESGMTVGIIGSTGSGKTTLAQLIPRLFDVTEGRILVGGEDVKRYDLDTLRGGVAMVLQKNLLFSGTIAENLRWGNENASDEELRDACRLACAEEFINEFPDGYDTKIEQGGTNVSGGQKQRLCIARALLKKPKILILDDSTSAVDMKTDALIREGFRKYIPETTKIIIAQRIASVQDADMIIVMDNGTASAAGDHETLLSTSQIYREVWEQQTRGGESDE